MRHEEIQLLQKHYGAAIQPLDAEDISDRIHDHFRLRRTTTFRRKLVAQIAPWALRFGTAGALRELGAPLPCRADLVAIGERFADDASRAALLRILAAKRVEQVLVPGCYLAGEDVQFWLRRGVKRLAGVDVYSLEKRWREIVPSLREAYGCEVSFRQASIEALPFEEARFDLVVTNAVLEHVRNLDAMVRETARVLKPGGFAWHNFGPLYHVFSGDHCASALGPARGYDHVLLDEAEYRRVIFDQTNYASHADPNLPFWARRDQFSFATPGQYFQAFERHFKVRHVVVKLCSDGLRFRREFPEQWQRMKAAGLDDATLLLKGLNVILEKR